jgi:hypothetical protein
MKIAIDSDPTHDNSHTHLTPKDAIKFTTTGGIETIQWRSNHIVDDWTNLHSYEKTDTDGNIAAIDIIHQLEHLPGINLDGNHTISIRGLQSNSSGGHSSSPLVTIDIMLMDTASAFIPESEEAPAFTFLAVSVASAIALFVNQRKSELDSIYEED